MPANPTRKVTVIPADVQMTEKDIRKQILRISFSVICTSAGMTVTFLVGLTCIFSPPFCRW